jgi:DNA polymerase
MSDQPIDIVFAALKQMQANGVHLRASLDSCNRLRASPSQKQASAPSRTDATAKMDAQPATHGRFLPPLHAAVPEAAKGPHPQPAPANRPTTTGARAAKLAALRGPVLTCAKCPHLVQSRTQVVFGVGNPEADLMFVGEAPGADEDLVGEPFVGRAGQLLTKIINAMGFRRPDVYIANVLKCRPNTPPGESGNRKPTHEEMDVCKPYLLQQIEIIQPKVLIALGGTAVDGLLGSQKEGITRTRGTWREFHGIPLMPTFHPSFLLRPTNEQMANKRRLWEDMLAVLERLGHEITAKQRGFFPSK